MLFKDLHDNYTVSMQSFKENADYVFEQSKRRKLPVQIMDHNTCVALAFTDDALEKLQAKIDQLEKRDQQLLKESKQLKKQLVRLEMENENLQAARDHIKDIKDMLY